MSYCQPNAHARQTILRGCCTGATPTCCNTYSSYDARKYCECGENAVLGANLTQSYAQALCVAITTGGVTGTYVGYTGFYANAFDNLDVSRFNCGTFDILVDGATGVTAAIVGNSDIDITNNPFPVGLYDVTIEQYPGSVCATVQITN